MNNFTNETFELIWFFTDKKHQGYTVVHEKQADVYKIYQNQDVEIAYPNYVVKSDHKCLDGFFYDNDNYFFVSAKNNLIHNETGPATFIPCGLNGFKPREEIKHYLIYGKIMSQHTWLTWVRDTSSWSEAMANILGKH